jgi:hypothetical protein
MATVRRLAAVALSMVLGAASAVTIGATPAQAAQHRDAHMYAYWNFNGANGFWNVDQQVRIATKAHHTYWAMNWGFTVTPNEGGYMGLQTNGIRFDGSTGETAIFSLWNANAASGSGCGRFGGEGVGYSCRVPYAFGTGVYYRYRLWRLNTDAGGQWWGAWMQNTATGADTYIGSIRVAAAKTLTTTPMNFTEYWGEDVGCNNVPVSVAYYTQPAANSQGGNTYQYGSVFASSYRGPCTGGSTTVVTVGTTRAARITMGGPR